VPICDVDVIDTINDDRHYDDDVNDDVAAVALFTDSKH